MDDSGSEITLAMRFRDFGGAYMEHCHNTQHEDHSMLLRWDIENPGQLSPFLTPEPQWNGCTYTDSFTLPTARTQENGRDRPGELVGDFKAKEDFLKDNNAAGLLCAAGATEACNSGTSTPVGNGGTQAGPTPDNNVTPVAPTEDTSTPPVAAEKPKKNKKDKKNKKNKKNKKRRGGKGKN
jgi:FtsP/CotA-like multicopper oxidase with cupredoxin domain